MTSTRPTAVAGSFYPATAAELNTLLDHCFSRSPLGPRGILTPSPALIAGMVPHAGPIYSGPCAAHLYARIDPSVRRVILIGVNHWARGHRAALSPWASWRTPLGEVKVDQELNECLEARVEFLERDPYAHAEEHSIEVQLPFLQRTLGQFTFAPISLARISPDDCAELGDAIASCCQRGEKIVILASSDLSHYLSPKQTDELDRLAIEQVLTMNPASLLNVVETENITMCGVIPTAVMLFAAKKLNVKRATLLKHCHSGDVTPMREVVGYASVALEL
ncbi:MAG: AmmeMemoRadiSam system protein B [Candidatus Binatia bacterium]